MDDKLIKQLIAKANESRAFSQAKYSNFKVGAALVTENGDIFTGSNVESTSYGLTICAERVALTKALSEGQTRFLGMAIVGPGSDYCPPCGAFRQLLYDYAPGIDIILTDLKTNMVIPLKDLLPMAFEETRLKNK